MSDESFPRGAQHLGIDVDGEHNVSALLELPPDPRACLVLAHGAGAGMQHPFMAAVASGLTSRGVGTLRYQFPYMESGARRPDRPGLAQATVRAAIAAAAHRAPRLPLFAGGKSFGGRMTSQAQALSPLPAVRGLIFFGFPLHPAKKPASERADHLDAVTLPMLFLQGTRDALADPKLMTGLVARLAPRAQMVAIGDADHSFHVPARTGRSDAAVMDAMLDDVGSWIERLVG